MRIGAALGLIAVGAILRFAIAISVIHSLYLQTVGDILMGVGLLGLLLWIIVWAPGPGAVAPPTAADSDGRPPVPAAHAHTGRLHPRRGYLRRRRPPAV